MPATILFPVGAVGITILSFLFPQILIGYKKAIVPLLGIIMFGMGMTLRPENFLEICKRPRAIAIGVGLQFLLMPLFAWLVSLAFGLPEMLMIGLVLVGSCPGGTASNVMCYLARGDVALSITLTTVSTIMAVFMTPLLTWLYIGEKVPVPVLAMMLNIFQIIIIPVVAGVLLNNYLHRFLGRVKHIFPFISTAAIILIIGIIVANTQSEIPRVALPVLAAIFWHNLLGLVAGYYLAKLFGLDERMRRTIAIEVGMQNSGLAVALANKYFSTLAALPGALFSIWHNITGSIAAGYWTRRVDQQHRDGDIV